LALAIAFGVASSACAAVFGFEDGIPIDADSGADGADEVSAPPPDDGAASSDATGSADVDACTTVEDCTNDRDDDCNGLVDCADPACSAWSCVPQVAGWSGPYELYEGPAGVAPPACGASFTGVVYNGNGGLAYVPPTCSACSCGGAMGLTCGAPSLTSYDAAGCATSCGNLTLNAACNTLPTCGAGNPVGAVAVTAAPTSGGSCTPSGGVPTKPAPTWSTVARGCGLARTGSGACGPTAACAPKTGLPFGTGQCIVQGGDVACPGGPYTIRHLYFTGFDDQRGCTTCNCGGVNGATCSTTVTLYTGKNCNNTAQPLTAPQTCATATGQPKSAASTSVVASPGSCDATGGAPMGAVSASGPTTFCCTP
jgi:hypothetical protein